MTAQELHLEINKAKEKQQRIIEVLEGFDKEFLATLSERMKLLCRCDESDNREKIDNIILLHLTLLSHKPFLSWHTTRDSEVVTLKESLEKVEKKLEGIQKELNADMSIYNAIKEIFK
jgi:hypothetical protein